MVTVSFGSNLQNPQDPSGFVYERRASGTTDDPPIAAHSTVKLINWANPYYPNRILVLEAIGTDQHDNSIYTWVVDGVTLDLSGPARVGSPEDPYKFAVPINAKQTIVLEITNNNSVAYPNAGSSPSDAAPYEGVFVGHWGS